MNQPIHFDWLFTELDGRDESLTVEQQSELQAHLSECAECRLLSGAWQAVSGELAAAPAAAPRPGFTTRWQAHLAADRHRRHRRQSLTFLSASLAGAALVVAAWILHPWPALGSFDLIIWTSIYQVLELVTSIMSLPGVLSGGITAYPWLLVVVIWVLAMAFLGQLLILGLISARVALQPRRVSK